MLHIELVLQRKGPIVNTGVFIVTLSTISVIAFFFGPVWGIYMTVTFTMGMVAGRLQSI